MDLFQGSRAALVVVSLAACATACSAIIGIGDVPDVSSGIDGSADASTDGASADASADASATDGATTDASPDSATDAPCVPTTPSAENCTDGIDNDCDGKTDCEDPACTQQGFACVPDVTTGWTYDAIDRANGAACPSGYGSQDLVASASGAAAMCSCSCGLTQLPSCTYGTLSANIGSASCGETTAGYQADGTCVPSSAVTPTLFSANAIAPSGGACSGNVSKSVPNRQETHWRACSSSGPFGRGCAAGHMCAIAGGAFVGCVTRQNTATCPVDYPVTQVVATGISDTRDCGACTCGAPNPASCSNATISFYPTTACASPAVTVNANGACTNTGAVTYQAYRYSATASASCGAPTQMPSPTGGVSTTGPITTCCLQ